MRKICNYTNLQPKLPEYLMEYESSFPENGWKITICNEWRLESRTAINIKNDG